MERAATLFGAWSRRLVFATGVLLFGGQAFATVSPTWQEWVNGERASVFRVAQYLDLRGDNNLVLLEMPPDSGLVAGAVLKTFRKSVPESGDGSPDQILWVETGVVKVVDVQSAFAVAEVQSQGSRLAQSLFPKFPGLMAGDVAVRSGVTVTRRPAVTPALSLAFEQLFFDPAGSPQSFELKAEGTAVLKRLAADFGAARVSLLMVEGYTDSVGPSEANQIESYQRALTVRQFLIDEMGFDPQRVVAVGYGEAEPSDQTQKPGAAQANRRIVIRTLRAP